MKNYFEIVASVLMVAIAISALSLGIFGIIAYNDTLFVKVFSIIFLGIGNIGLTTFFLWYIWN